MDFNFSEEQQLLKKAARDFAKGECTSDFVRRMEEDEKGYTDELWNKMAELGWMGLMLPEEYEGIGWGLVDLVVIMEEMGGTCVPGPYLSTVLGSLAVLEGGSDAQKSKLLPKVAAGESVLTLANLEPGSVKYEPTYAATTAAKEGDGFVLEGTKIFVSDAHVADYLVVLARTSGETISRDGLSLFLVPRKNPGVRLTELKTISGDKQFEVILNGVKVEKDALLGQLDQGFGIFEKILKIGAVAKCAEMVGGAQTVLDMTVEYAKERVQFGKAIGKFQAVQHHCSNMVIDVTGSRFITFKAAWMLSENMPCDLVVASAKGFVSEAYKRVCALGHQIGAATAYCVEHDMTLYSRRAKSAELAFGDAAYHRNIAAAAIGL